MSTVKAINLQHASATSPNITLGADGSVAVGGGNISPQTGFRNRIINGDMRIDQRNNGASVTMSTAIVYTVDRWWSFEDTDGTMTAQQSSIAPTGFTNSLLCTTTVADTSLGSTQRVVIAQIIEGFNVADLGWGTANAQTVTLSFWVRSSLTGTFGGAVKNGNSTRAYPFTYTISAANTWEQKTVTIAGDTAGTWLTNNGNGIQIHFCLGAGSAVSGTAGAWSAADLNSATGAVSVVGTAGATFYITGVQLEKGSVATPFEFRSIGQELALCQRYYQSGSSRMVKQNCDTLRICIEPINFMVLMRSSPTLTNTNTDSLNVAFAYLSNPSPNGFSFAWQSTSTIDFGNTFNWRASAEL